MKHIVMYSGGAGSWATAMRVREQYGTDNLYLVFADTLIEDEDLYRFIEESAKQIGGTLVWLKDGRDIWEVFKDDRFLGNSRLANCSKFLKQRPSREWLEANATPDDCVVYVGIDWSELHRLPAIEAAYKPYTAKAPMTEKPYIDKDKMISWMEAEGVKPPRLYGLGFAHNNCGGFCVRSGQAQFKKLLELFPDRYAAHQAKEEELRQYLGKDVSILKDRRGGETKPMTMAAFRDRVEQESSKVEEDDWGGCGCFVDSGESQ
jgi:hypothetical protein